MAPPEASRLLRWMFPDLLSSALAVIGAWAALSVIGNERQRRQGEIAATQPPTPPPAPPAEPVKLAPAPTAAATKPPSAGPAGMSRQQAVR